jgi:hypothetical protein
VNGREAGRSPGPAVRERRCVSRSPVSRAGAGPGRRPSANIAVHRRQTAEAASYFDVDDLAELADHLMDASQKAKGHVVRDVVPQHDAGSAHLQSRGRRGDPSGRFVSRDHHL